MSRYSFENDLAFLAIHGFVNVKNLIAAEEFEAASRGAECLLKQFPFGFDNPPLYSGLKPTPRAKMPVPSDKAPTIIVPNAGFLAPEILAPLANPALLEFVERIVGKDFYLSNTWLQVVPPGVGRLAYHKDPRGSITLNILLDDIDPKTGSTCVVPGSHINTPPAAYCMTNIQKPHKDEVDLTGRRGDTVFFSAET